MSAHPYTPTLADLDFAVVRNVSGSPVVLKCRRGFRWTLDAAGIAEIARKADVRYDEARDVLLALGVIERGDA